MRRSLDTSSLTYGANALDLLPAFWSVRLQQPRLSDGLFSGHQMQDRNKTRNGAGHIRCGLLLPAVVALSTGCALPGALLHRRNQAAHGQISLLRKKAPEGSSRTMPSTAEWNYYREGL